MTRPADEPSDRFALLDQPGPELVVHLYAPDEGPLSEAAYEYLRSVWAACRQQLAMVEPVAAFGLGTRPPESLTDLGLPGPTAVQQRADGSYQAVLRRQHDLLFLSVLLQGTDEHPSTWQDLDADWESVAGSAPQSLVGAVRLYQGYCVDPRGLRTGREPFERLAEHLPPGTCVPGHASDGIVTQSGFFVCEVGELDDRRIERRLVAVARPDQEADLSAWSWSRGDLWVPPLPRYLGHAAKLRYQLRVWDGGNATRRLRNRSNRQATYLASVFAQLGLLGLGGRQASAVTPTDENADLAAGDVPAAVGRLRADAFRLAMSSAAVSDMKRSVEIASANLAATASGEVSRSAPEGFVADDSELAAQFAHHLDDDIAFLVSARTRAQEVLALADRLGDVIRPTRSEPTDLTLSDDDRHALHYLLATLYEPGPDAAALMDRLGVAKAHLMASAGVTSYVWWHDTLSRLDNGVRAAPNPYRDLLAFLLDDWPGNSVVASITGAHGVRARPVE